MKQLGKQFPATSPPQKKTKQIKNNYAAHLYTAHVCIYIYKYIPDARPAQGQFACEHCDKVFPTAPTLGAHAFQLHGQSSEERKYIQSTIRPVCLRDHHTTWRVQQHLRYRQNGCWDRIHGARLLWPSIFLPTYGTWSACLQHGVTMAPSDQRVFSVNVFNNVSVSRFSVVLVQRNMRGGILKTIIYIHCICICMCICVCIVYAYLYVADLLGCKSWPFGRMLGTARYGPVRPGWFSDWVATLRYVSEDLMLAKIFHKWFIWWP